MASEAARREGESRLHELLEKTVEAVTRLNDSILGLSDAQSCGQHRNPTQAELRKHDRHAALSSEEPPNSMAVGESGRATTSSCIPLPAFGHFNEVLEIKSREAEVASQDGEVVGSEHGVSDADDVMFKLVTFTSEIEISSITAVDLEDTAKVILDLDQIPGVVCGLALQATANATAKDKECSWLLARNACIRSACLSGRSKWHPAAHQLAACQTCSNMRNVCLGEYQDDQGKFTLRVRPLASQFRRGAALRDSEAWVLPVDNGRRTLTRNREWPQGSQGHL